MDKMRRLYLPSADGPDLHSTKRSRTLCERSSVSNKWTLGSVYDDEKALCNGSKNQEQTAKMDIIRNLMPA